MTLSTIWQWLKTNSFVKAAVLTVFIIVAIAVMITLVALGFVALGWLFTDGLWLWFIILVAFFLGFIFVISYVIVEDAKDRDTSVWRSIWDNFAPNGGDVSCDEDSEDDNRQGAI